MGLNELADRIKEDIKIQFNVQDFIDTDFEDGQELMFILCQGHLSAFVDRKKMIIRIPYIGREFMRVKGKAIEKFYNSLSTAILKEREEAYTYLQTAFEDMED